MGRSAVLLFSLAILAAADVARADSAPVYVIPGRPDVPVVINHFDARYAVVEGDWGLSRPGHMQPTVIGGRYYGPVRGPIRQGRYFPTRGSTPVQGRHEVEPAEPRQMPPQAEDYSRRWSTTSSRKVEPADLPNAAPTEEGAAPNPPVIVVPQFGPRRRP